MDKKIILTEAIKLEQQNIASYITQNLNSQNCVQCFPYVLSNRSTYTQLQFSARSDEKVEETEKRCFILYSMGVQ